MVVNCDTPNLDIAWDFLTALDEEAEFFTFQTFDDGKDKRPGLVKTWHADLDDIAEELEELNNKGAGIFVTVNETDGKARTAKNITRVRAVFADFDKGVPPLDTAPLEPHIVVESSPGRQHWYWLVDDLPLDKFKAVQKSIIQLLDSDDSVHDLPRVMRLPGFLHKKDPDNPHQVKLREVKPYQPYKAEKILEAFPPVEDRPAPKLPVVPGTASEVAGDTQAANIFKFAIGDVATAPDGERNDTLNTKAYKLFGLVKAGRLDRTEVETQLHKMATSIGLSQSEIKATLKSAWTSAEARLLDAASGVVQPGHNGAPKDNAWPVPLPLTANIEPAPYPLDALPDIVRAAVEEVRAFTQAPIALVAASALAALSLATQAFADVKRAEKLIGPLCLYLLSIADSGERKSTCDGFFMQPIRDYEAEQAEAAKPLIKDHKATMEAWEAKRGGIKEKIRSLAKNGKSTLEQEEELRVLEHEKPEPPRVPRLIYSDATPEALKWNLAKGWPSGGVVSSEAGIVFGAHGMGKDSVMRNLATLNQLWDGADIATERRTTESFTVRGARLTIALQVQEATLHSFFDRSGDLARGTGFLARFLLSWPESTQGYRPFVEPPQSWPALASFNQRITGILEQEVPIDEDGALTPPVLSLAADTKKAWVTFHDAIESKLRSGGELYDVRDVASKIADNAVRIAALFHLFECGNGGAIGLAAFEGASRIATWHLNEARRFFGELALPEEQVAAVRLDSWLLDYCQKRETNIIPRREVQRNVTPVRLRKKAALDAALAVLAETGRVCLVQEGTHKDIHINPILLEEKQ